MDDAVDASRAREGAETPAVTSREEDSARERVHDADGDGATRGRRRRR